MASCDLPTPPRHTRAIRAAGARHRFSIWSRMSPRLTKSGSREKGIAANGSGGVSGRSENVSGVSLGSSGGNLTQRQVEFRIDRPVILHHLEIQVQRSKRRGWHLRMLVDFSDMIGTVSWGWHESRYRTFPASFFLRTYASR